METVRQPEASWIAPETPGDPGAKAHVVAFGASAGGLSALKTLFSRMPAKPGFASVVVMHLSPDHDSHLAELLQPSTQMPVLQVTETIALESDHVYIIPPNANLDSVDTHLRLSPLERRRSERAPIDHFLRTLATTHDGAGICAVLTGAGSDGSLGLRHIRESGGLTIAQDPVEAEYDSMPRSAIATGLVDLVLPLRDIPDQILRFCAVQPRLPVPDGDDGIDEGDAATLEQILGELRLRTGQEFAMYKRDTLLRRIRKRMQINHVETLNAYLEVLRPVPAEARALRNDLLLNVSEFFRDADMMECLEKQVLPPLLARKRDREDRVRVWSVGCSTGEEAYSLAMLMIEAAARYEVKPVLQVFATDLSDEVLGRAREGVYPEEVAATVSPERLERFFVRESGHYRVGREVRDTVVFASHDLFEDPPFSHMDLVVCRSLLSDLQPAVRRGVLNLFYYALEPQGMLLIGPHDTVGEARLFARTKESKRLYRRASGPRQLFTLPASIHPFKQDMQLSGASPAAKIRGGKHDLASIHRMALEQCTAPSVLVNQRNQIVHYSPHAGRYVRLPGGEPTHDIGKLVREPVRSHLMMALEMVRRDGLHWKSEPLTVMTEGGASEVTLRVDKVPSEIPGLLLVVFEEQAAAAKTPTDITGEAPSEASVTQPGDELAETRRRLRAVMDAYRAEQNQLSSAGGTLRSAHGELAVVQEELESAREELQVVNLELKTLDRENSRRLGELAQISADLQHLLESTGIATLFLNRELRIIRFTPQLGDLFKIRRSDVGRPLSDLTHGLRYDNFEADTRTVLETSTPLDVEVCSLRGQWYLMRMLPYRPVSSRIEGVVVTLIDITDRKRAEETLREADRGKDQFLAVLAHELRNPLAPISSGVEILKLAAHDRRMVEQVAATMGRQTRQLVRLVDDLLEVSRINSGKLRLQKSLVQMSDIIRDAVAAARPSAERAGHELTVTVTEETVMLDADPARLTQVLVNLLSNAVRYTPRPGRLALSAQREGNEAVITVSDDGIGIAADAVEHVFEMFYQGNNPNYSHDAGLGIGLTLAKSLIEMHGGSIGVESDGLDHGSRFTLRIPVSTQVPAASAKRPQERLKGDQRILIIDDNVDAGQTLCALIRALGDEDVHVASNGAKGLEMAATLHPDIILLDLMMPDMDGYEVAQRLRREPWGKGVFLVALTGWGQEDHKRRTREAGFDRHLTKPVDCSVLQAVLHEPRPPEKKSA